MYVPTAMGITVMDLDPTSPTFRTEQLIPVTNGGTFFNLATRHSIDVSEDGRFVYTVAEVAVIPTGIVAQNELAVDRLNEWLYLTGLDPTSDQGRVIGIDVRAGSLCHTVSVQQR